MERVAYTIEECAKSGVAKRAKLYDEIKKGRLRAVKNGRLTRILVSDWEAYLASLPAKVPSGRGGPVAPRGDTPRKRRRRRRQA
jgi:excisionase family DNA binding protein